MTDQTVTPPRRGFLGRLLRGTALLVAGAGLGAGGFAAGMFYAGDGLSPAEEVLRLIDQGAVPLAAGAADVAEGAATPERVPRPSPEESAFLTSYYEFPEALTTNLAGSRRFLQVQVGVSTQYDAQVIANIERHAMAIRSDMLAVISGFPEEGVAGAEGRAALATALAEAINARLTRLEGFGGVEDVFFPSFVLQ
jgi:flagellar protein FliL